jgi:cell division inhibitor SulA
MVDIKKQYNDKTMQSIKRAVESGNYRIVFDIIENLLHDLAKQNSKDPGSAPKGG